MLEDHKKLLYPTAEEEQKKVGYHTGIVVMEGKEWCIQQGIWGVTDFSKRMLPKANELPSTSYAAKQVICPLGLEI
jgi:hypothetical protein